MRMTIRDQLGATAATAALQQSEITQFHSRGQEFFTQSLVSLSQATKEPSSDEDESPIVLYAAVALLAASSVCCSFWTQKSTQILLIVDGGPLTTEYGNLFE